jgi:hypothetical protein
VTVSAQPIAAGLLLLLLAACAADQSQPPLRSPPGETITGSNIPRREGQVRRETNVIVDPTPDVFKTNSSPGKGPGMGG